MRYINQEAQKVMDFLTHDLDGGKTRKIANSTAFMAVHVEKLWTGEMFTCYSVAHYYTQEGDLMSDPRMEFLKARNGKYYPSYFRQDGFLGRDEESIVETSPQLKYRPRMQREHAIFAGKWMKNIKNQQRLEV